MINTSVAILNRIAHRTGSEKFPMWNTYTPKCDLIIDEVIDHFVDIVKPGGAGSEVCLCLYNCADYVGPNGTVIGVKPSRFQKVYSHAYSNAYDSNLDMFLANTYPSAFLNAGFGAPYPAWSERVSYLQTMLNDLEEEIVLSITPSFSVETTHRRIESLNREPYSDTTETYTTSDFQAQNTVTFTSLSASECYVFENSYAPRISFTNPYSREMVFYLTYALIPEMGVSLSGVFDADYTNVPVNPVIANRVFNNTNDQNTFNSGLQNVTFSTCSFTLSGNETADFTDIAVPSGISAAVSESLIQEVMNTTHSLTADGNTGSLEIRNSFTLKPYLLSGYFT